MRDKEHPHEKKPKHHGPGPKERELATQLTVAVLHASRPADAGIDDLTERVASVYGKMLALVASEAPASG